MKDKHQRRRLFSRICMAVCTLAAIQMAEAQIVLIGDNTPMGMLNDGDFSVVKSGWRKGDQSPFWRTVQSDKAVSTTDATMGIDAGRMFCSSTEGVAESKTLDTNPEYQHPAAGDRLHWSFDADLEYISKGTLSVSLVFGKAERMLAEKVALVGSDRKPEAFSGVYVLTAEDASAGLPHLRVRYYSEKTVKVYLDNVRVAVEKQSKTPPTLTAKSAKDAIVLTWEDRLRTAESRYEVYRKEASGREYKPLGSVNGREYVDKDFVSGKQYDYAVVRKQGAETSGGSNVATAACRDQVAPMAVPTVEAEVYDSEIGLSWQASPSEDVESYALFRGDAKGEKMVQIADACRQTHFEDIYAPKGVENTYVVYAKDYSGNLSQPSTPLRAKVRIVDGASFSDLILPMPMGKGLTRDTWGGDNVLPRDVDNGIESPDWTYWGGRPTFDKSDGRFHMLVVRWPESAIKGHWEWPLSTVAHTVADNPIGPYRVVKDIAYDYKDGLGHNADIIKLRDGTFALYSLIDWVPTIFTSKTMNGPWTRLGEVKVHWQAMCPEESHRDYQFYRNLSGVQTEDGRIIMVTKFGAMMVSDSGLLGPYEVVTKTVSQNMTIPERYRKSNYEDPVIWQDEVQFHLLINAFLDKRAIYLRSGDGIHWVFDPGLAYTKDFTVYENGVRNVWDKLERPHVIQDEFGRATHLSLAVIDVPKHLEYGNDNHNSKNLIIPLRLTRRMEMLNSDSITNETKTIRILIKGEKGFNPSEELDLSTLKLGASIEVNYGRGCRIVASESRGNDLYVEFDGKGHGLKASDFACKLIGRTKKGALVVAYSKVIGKKQK